jgi:hypothetical protein
MNLLIRSQMLYPIELPVLEGRAIYKSPAHRASDYLGFSGASSIRASRLVNR